MQRTLIVIGLAIVALGLLWPVLPRLGLGRLPGDIVVERSNFSFYFHARHLRGGQHRAERGVLAGQSVTSLRRALGTLTSETPRTGSLKSAR